MFEKVSQAAERVATNVSRRAFLGKPGQEALMLAGTLGAILALPSESLAGGKGGHKCCFYFACPHIGCIRVQKNESCPVGYCGGGTVVACDDPRCG